MAPEPFWFGRRSPRKANIAAWGARAIFDGRRIDLLPDRQSWSKSGPEPKTRLRLWINEKALPWLRAEVKRTRLATTDSTVLTFDDTGFHLEASPQ